MKKTIVYGSGSVLSYAEFGDQVGYPILVQHGLIASIDDSTLFNRLLRANLRVICIARPGYGESSPYVLRSYAEWADLAGRIIEALRLAEFDVLGMSSGAPFSYAIGYRFPEKVHHVYILSGIPALYDEKVLELWPYPSLKDKSVADLQPLARELFFSGLTEADLQNSDIRDSMMNDCFGVAQDLRLRFKDWGFSLADVRAKVFMRHSKSDEPFQAAVRTAELFPDCQLELTETGPHFSPETLDDFIEKTILKYTREGK